MDSWSISQNINKSQMLDNLSSLCYNYSLDTGMNNSFSPDLMFDADCHNFMDNNLPSELLIIIQCFYAIICISGIFGNTLVIYVVLMYTKMQTVTNMYILNLALADECFLVGIPFLITTSAIGYWPFGKIMCKIYFTTTSINQFTSSIFLTVMSADRFLAVCHPISSPRFRTPFIARCVSLTAWAVSALLMVPVFMYASTINKLINNDHQSCNIIWPISQNGHDSFINNQTAFTMYSFTLGFAIPLTLILIFYAFVIFKLKAVGPKNKSKGKKKFHRKVTRLVLTVITVYIMCWLPYWITQLALIFTPPGQSQDKLMIFVMLFVSCLSYSNSAINPILYAFLSENFKKSFYKACTCSKKDGASSMAAPSQKHRQIGRKRELSIKRETQSITTEPKTPLAQERRKQIESEVGRTNDTFTSITTVNTSSRVECANTKDASSCSVIVSESVLPDVQKVSSNIDSISVAPPTPTQKYTSCL